MEFLPDQQTQTGGAIPSPVPVLSTAALGLALSTSHLEKVSGWGGGGQKGAVRMSHRFLSQAASVEVQLPSGAFTVGMPALQPTATSCFCPGVGGEGGSPQLT